MSAAILTLLRKDGSKAVHIYRLEPGMIIPPLGPEDSIVAHSKEVVDWIRNSGANEQP